MGRDINGITGQLSRNKGTATATTTVRWSIVRMGVKNVLVEHHWEPGKPTPMKWFDEEFRKYTDAWTKGKCRGTGTGRQWSKKVAGSPQQRKIRSGLLNSRVGSRPGQTKLGVD